MPARQTDGPPPSSTLYAVHGTHSPKCAHRGGGGHTQTMCWTKRALGTSPLQRLIQRSRVWPLMLHYHYMGIWSVCFTYKWNCYCNFKPHTDSTHIYILYFRMNLFGKIALSENTSYDSLAKAGFAHSSSDYCSTPPSRTLLDPAGIFGFSTKDARSHTNLKATHSLEGTRPNDKTTTTKGA